MKSWRIETEDEKFFRAFSKKRGTIQRRKKWNFQGNIPRTLKISLVFWQLNIQSWTSHSRDTIFFKEFLSSKFMFRWISSRPFIVVFTKSQFFPQNSSFLMKTEEKISSEFYTEKVVLCAIVFLYSNSILSLSAVQYRTEWERGSKYVEYRAKKLFCWKNRIFCAWLVFAHIHAPNKSIHRT